MNQGQGSIELRDQNLNSERDPLNQNPQVVRGNQMHEPGMPANPANQAVAPENHNQPNPELIAPVIPNPQNQQMYQPVAPADPAGQQQAPQDAPRRPGGNIVRRCFNGFCAFCALAVIGFASKKLYDQYQPEPTSNIPPALRDGYGDLSKCAKVLGMHEEIEALKLTSVGGSSQSNGYHMGCFHSEKDNKVSAIVTTADMRRLTKEALELSNGSKITTRVEGDTTTRTYTKTVTQEKLDLNGSYRVTLGEEFDIDGNQLDKFSIQAISRDNKIKACTYRHENVVRSPGSYNPDFNSRMQSIATGFNSVTSERWQSRLKECIGNNATGNNATGNSANEKPKSL